MRDLRSPPVHGDETMPEHGIRTVRRMTFHSTIRTTPSAGPPPIKPTPTKHTPIKVTPLRQTPVKPTRT
jgi:hypothetical protein